MKSKSTNNKPPFGGITTHSEFIISKKTGKKIKNPKYRCSPKERVLQQIKNLYKHPVRRLSKKELDKSLQEFNNEFFAGDKVKPNYYKSKSGLDVIDISIDFDLCPIGQNVFKYVVRAGKKDPSKELEDWTKAREYIDRKIKLLENEKRISKIKNKTKTNKSTTKTKSS